MLRVDFSEREGEKARRGGGGRSTAVLGFNREEGERANGPVGPNGRKGQMKLG
jgi:hypothetical protein